MADMVTIREEDLIESVADALQCHRTKDGVLPADSEQPRRHPQPAPDHRVREVLRAVVKIVARCLVGLLEEVPLFRPPLPGVEQAVMKAALAVTGSFHGPPYELQRVDGEGDAKGAVVSARRPR